MKSMNIADPCCMCVYCGNMFLIELIEGKSIQTANLGGVEILLHDECKEKLFSLAIDGQFPATAWILLPPRKSLDSNSKEISRIRISKLLRQPGEQGQNK
jgi:hypothetical protein